jgi:hypothetical protein
MKQHKEHIVFAAIVALVLGGIGMQTMRSEATAAAPTETISPTELTLGVHDLPMQALAAP